MDVGFEDFFGKELNWHNLFIKPSIYLFDYYSLGCIYFWQTAIIQFKPTPDKSIA